MTAPAEVTQFVSEHDDFVFVRDDSKVQCTLTKQEFTCRLAILQEYIQSKAFTKAKAKGKKLDLGFDFSKYEPHITQHKKMKHALFCQLTGSCLNKIEAEVEKHVNGKRYQIHHFSTTKIHLFLRSQVIYLDLYEE